MTPHNVDPSCERSNLADLQYLIGPLNVFGIESF